ncbi:hypothetical protein RvY_19152 [Ramazzottius varieornatus]|uniref:GDP-fucose protein O-fucosyltransferase 2 n=1 Tax=Ramazzottius varieornatus TaxID=947166 RepID=A0A1D1WAL7_RAMVA|nr:hypothetical protein RvY_19152 [Ramazzottius varieornatus]
MDSLFVLFKLAYLVLCSSEDVTLSVSSSTTFGRDESCTRESCSRTRRYLLYDVNPGEGFNLRRDVYLRAAIFLKHLNDRDTKNEWTLVLPPWGPLYHWQRRDIPQEGLPWSLFFDILSLNSYVPVMEFDDYLAERKLPVIEQIFYLLSFDFDKIDLQSEWLLEEANCDEIPAFPYVTNPQEQHVEGWIWGYAGISPKKIQCYRTLGSADSIISRLLALTSTKDRAVMFERFENVLHDHFSGKEYWAARKSMKFAKNLVELAENFRKEFLSQMETDHEVTYSATATNESTGGPYICAHLRRQDYLRARPDEVPSMKEAALQLRHVFRKQSLNTVFVATDGTDQEIKELKGALGPGFNVVTYRPPENLLQKIKEGGAAIVEQITCSHSKYFIGSYESTFSFRIQEERELMGFSPDTTFNRFCKFSHAKCQQPTQWRVEL